MTGQWENSPRDSDLKYNPMDGDWSYERKDSDLEYNPWTGKMGIREINDQLKRVVFTALFSPNKNQFFFE